MKNFRRAAASILLVLLAMNTWADWSKVRSNFQSAKSHDEAVKKIAESDEAKQQDFKELIDDYNSAETKEAKNSTYQSIKDLIDSSVTSEQFSTVSGADDKAKKIKQNQLYKSEREAKSSNWLVKLFERLKDLFKPRPQSDITPPEIPPWIPELFKGIFYLIGIAILVGLVYLLFQIPWGWTKRGRARKLGRGGLLEEGEELLSEDQYLIEADRLVAEGKFREACRALYLASLLRIDSARIARFEPTQTNWEHLRRIDNSKLKPEGFEFRATTKAFDHAWYGFTARTINDVQIFRESYLLIKQLTEVPK